jgi:MoaA/NifB/PqqE/SkfB family radical SAM enzyme
MILDPQEKKRRSLLRLKSIESGELLIGPETVEFFITDLCNLACHFCWYYGLGVPHPPAGKNHLPFDVFERTVRDCIDLQVNTVFLSGEGEPTLHSCFYEMLQRLEPSFEITLFTNGTFPLKRCRDILRADHIVINLGAADRESYRALKGNDLFFKVLKNIRELARLKAEFNPNACIEVVFVASRLNIDSFKRTETLAKRLGADIVRKKIAESNGYDQQIILPDGQDKTEALSQWPPCYQGWFFSALRLNGDVHVCPYMRRMTIGNIYKASFKDIWQSETYARARASVLEGNPFRTYHECINCRLAWHNQEISSQMETYTRVLNR